MTDPDDDGPEPTRIQLSPGHTLLFYTYGHEPHRYALWWVEGPDGHNEHVVDGQRRVELDAPDEDVVKVRQGVALQLRHAANALRIRVDYLSEMARVLAETAT